MKHQLAICNGIIMSKRFARVTEQQFPELPLPPAKCRNILGPPGINFLPIVSKHMRLRVERRVGTSLQCVSWTTGKKKLTSLENFTSARGKERSRIELAWGKRPNFFLKDYIRRCVRTAQAQFFSNEFSHQFFILEPNGIRSNRQT